MSGEFESAGLGSAPRQGVYKELRQNPYLLGLSAVTIFTMCVTVQILIAISLLRLGAFFLVTIKVSLVVF